MLFNLLLYPEDLLLVVIDLILKLFVLCFQVEDQVFLFIAADVLLEGESASGRQFPSVIGYHKVVLVLVEDALVATLRPVVD